MNNTSKTELCRPLDKKVKKYFNPPRHTFAKHVVSLSLPVATETKTVDGAQKTDKK